MLRGFGMSIQDMTAEENLALSLRAVRDLGGGQEALDAATARNILHEELGYFKSKSTDYTLDEVTRDRLLAHARQDAAHALIATLTTGRNVKNLERAISLLVLCALALIAIQVWTVFLR